MGVMARNLLPNIPLDSLGNHLVRSSFRADQSPLLSDRYAGNWDIMLPTVLNNAAGNLPLATLSISLRTWYNGSSVSAVPPFLDASGPGGAALNPFNVTEMIGFPGTYSYVAFAQVRFLHSAVSRGCWRGSGFFIILQGSLTKPWVPVTCTDRINLVSILDVGYTSGSCPTLAELFTPIQGTTGPTYVRQGVWNGTLACPANNCGAPLRGTCVCGTCVCAPGWDGSSDCSVPFHGDAYSLLFATDPLYQTRYGGLAVVDQRQQVRIVILQ
jgi:hypothetical protein